MITVLIERTLAPDMESTYEASAKRTLHLAYQAEGFVNGETYSDIHNANKRYVFSKWRSARDWYNWYNSEARRNMMNELMPMLGEPEKIALLEN